MAEPVSFAEANLTYAAPGAGPADMLPCSLVGAGRAGGIVTCWQFTLQEIAAMLRDGGRCWAWTPDIPPPGLLITGFKGMVL